MRMPPVVSAEEWNAAREELLRKEKEHTRAKDALAAERRRLPRVRVEKQYTFEGPDGKVGLPDLFEGRRQLIIYRHFFEPGVADWPAGGCSGCAMFTDNLGHLAHLGFAYDASFQDDDYPYVVQVASGKKIVELPSFQFFDDSTLYNPRHSHIRLLKIWKEEFDAVYSEGNFVNLTLHPRGDYGSGRTVRARIVDDFLTYVRRHPGVYFATCREMATWWQDAHPQCEPANAGIAPFDARLARG